MNPIKEEPQAAELITPFSLVQVEQTAEKPTEEMQTLYTSPGVRALMQPRSIPRSTVSRFATSHSIVVDGVTISLDIDDDDLGWIRYLGANEQKMLLRCITAFTEINSIDQLRNGRLNLELFIPTGEYARHCGVDYDNPTHAKNFRRAVRRSLGILRNIEIRGAIEYYTQVGGKGTEGDATRDINLIGSRDVTPDYICVNLDNRFARTLLQGKIMMRLHTSFYKIGPRNKNAGAMYFSMISHFSNYNNQKKGTHDRLRVSVLLEKTDLKDIKTVRAARHSWKSNIKKFLEESLNHLIDVGALTCWEYGRVNGERLTDKEIKRLNNSSQFTYEEWADLRVYFTPTGEQEFLEAPKDIEENDGNNENDKNEKGAQKMSQVPKGC